MIEFTVKGQPPSKSNCYKIIKKYIKGRQVASIGKTPALEKYEFDFLAQVPGQCRRLNINKPMSVELHCTFNSKRPDLDNAAKAILDCLQRSGVIKNDNLVYELFMTKSVNKDMAGVIIKIEEL